MLDELLTVAGPSAGSGPPDNDQEPLDPTRSNRSMRTRQDLLAATTEHRLIGTRRRHKCVP
jgi:hypothetical protein